MSGKDNLRACEALTRMRDMLDTLLGPEGCPWDREQSLSSLCDYLVEEVYELNDAIRYGKLEEQREELGDVIFILVFMGYLAERDGLFSLADSLDESTQKMIGRHPHVFGDVNVDSQEEIVANWEEIKKAEKARKNDESGVFASLPVSLPALEKAYRIHSKSSRNRFTWDTDEDAEQQVEAEWLEWLDACESQDQSAMEHELGDLIFTLVELGRRKGLKASAALEHTNQRFLNRFKGMEALAAARGLDFSALDQAAKDALWDEVKEAESAKEPQ